MAAVVTVLVCITCIVLKGFSDLSRFTFQNRVLWHVLSGFSISVDVLYRMGFCGLYYQGFLLSVGVLSTMGLCGLYSHGFLIYVGVLYRMMNIVWRVLSGLSVDVLCIMGLCGMYCQVVVFISLGICCTE